MRALLIPAGGLPEEVEVSDENELDDLQRYVGGWIEYVPTDQDVTLYCNEEGKILNLPPNPLATELFGSLLMPGDYLAGDVILLGLLDEDGASTSIDPEWIKTVRVHMAVGG